MMIVVDVISKGKCIVCGKEATDLLFCDDCNRKRKELGMTREQLRKGTDIVERIKTIDNILKRYNDCSNAIIGISIINDNIGVIDPIPDGMCILEGLNKTKYIKMETIVSIDKEVQND